MCDVRLITGLGDRRVGCVEMRWACVDGGCWGEKGVDG